MNKKYLTVLDNEAVSIQAYCDLHPENVLKETSKNVVWYGWLYGWQIVINRVLSCYSSPKETVDFVKRYKPINYSIETIFHDELILIQSDNIAGHSITIKNKYTGKKKEYVWEYNLNLNTDF